MAFFFHHFVQILIKRSVKPGTNRALDCTVTSARLKIDDGRKVAEVSAKVLQKSQKGRSKIGNYSPHKISCVICMKYGGCSNMNASSFITFFTYVLQQNGKGFYKGLYVTLKLAPDLKKTTVYLSSYSPSNKGHDSILTNSMLRTYTSDIDERIILR